MQAMGGANQKIKEICWNISETIAGLSKQHRADLEEVYQAVDDFGGKFRWLHGEAQQNRAGLLEFGKACKTQGEWMQHFSESGKALELKVGEVESNLG